jgi:hypothetical protein
MHGKIIDSKSRYYIAYSKDNLRGAKRLTTLRGCRQFLQRVQPQRWAIFEENAAFYSLTQTEYLVAQNDPFYGSLKFCVNPW